MANHFLIVILLFGMFSCFSFAQESFDLNEVKYQRKSIASIDQVVVLSDDYNLINASTVQAVLEPHIALSRFDRNLLPQSLSQLFLDAVYATANHTVESLGRLIKDVYANEIQLILTDPSIQKARIKQFKETDVFTFEYGKGKSYSVTASDLEKLFSSAFFYIPYISNSRFTKTYFTKKVDDTETKMKKISVGVDAGVIWYQIKVLPDQSITVQFIENIGVSSYETHNKLASNNNDDDTVNDLLLSCLTNIGIQLSYHTKKMSVFNLRGRIDSVNNNELQLDLSVKDGVALDDYFWIMEDYQSKDGYKSKPVGLTFVSEFVDDQTKFPFSKATQIFGNKHHVGSWVKESPRYGVSLKMNLGYINGFHLDSRDSLINSDYFFQNDVSSAVGFDFSLSYLLSKSLLTVPYSQLFFDLNFGFAPLSMEYGNLIDGSYSPLSSLQGIYFGFRKLFWLNQVAYQPFFYFGRHQFNISENGIFSFFNEDESDDTMFELNQSVFKFGVSIEKMILPYVLVNASFFKTLSIGSPSRQYVLNYDSIFSSSYEDVASHSKLNLGGFLLGVHVLF